MFTLDPDTPPNRKWISRGIQPEPPPVRKFTRDFRLAVAKELEAAQANGLIRFPDSDQVRREVRQARQQAKRS